ncbi:MAG: MotA/TolQ/ExbB proton channel family protein [Verrucomicrobia bacterium]|nr:MotA/TolQ/ExbB proton channel family protein [Verrucomicrobiota bacterium]
MMWPILICSIIGVAVIADRLYAHGRAILRYPVFLDRLREAFKAEGGAKAPEWLAKQKSPEASIAVIYWQYARVEAQVRNEALRREGERILAEWNKHLKIIYTIAQVTPLMGLLGTVFGLVVAFYNIEALGGRVRPDDLAGGIWEALLTTVAGLMVAIPALLAFQYFQSSGERKARRMKEVVSILDEIAQLES